MKLIISCSHQYFSPYEKDKKSKVSSPSQFLEHHTQTSIYTHTSASAYIQDDLRKQRGE